MDHNSYEYTYFNFNFDKHIFRNIYRIDGNQIITKHLGDINIIHCSVFIQLAEAIFVLFHSPYMLSIKCT